MPFFSRIQWRALPAATVVAVIAFASLVLIPGLRPPARAAAPFVVNSAADTQDNTCGTDPGGCTIRDAIAAANAAGGADSITFDPAVFPPDNSGPEIVLSSSLPALNATAGITIDGAGAGVKINAGSSNDASQSSAVRGKQLRISSSRSSISRTTCKAPSRSAAALRRPAPRPYRT